jgi:hypothetical protein
MRKIGQPNQKSTAGSCGTTFVVALVGHKGNWINLDLGCGLAASPPVSAATTPRGNGTTEATVGLAYIQTAKAPFTCPFSQSGQILC